MIVFNQKVRQISTKYQSKLHNPPFVNGASHFFDKQKSKPLTKFGLLRNG